jgi:tetratricopeptide (TPR) repeat protein
VRGALTIWLLAAVAGVGMAAAQQRNSAPPPPPPTLDELETRARRDSLDPDAHFRLAVRYYRLKRFDDEERELRTTIAIDPRHATAYLWLADLPFDRRPKLWQDLRKRKVPPALQPAVEESFRLWRHAFLIDPMVDFRVPGSTAPPEDLVTIPDYGRATTNFLLMLGLGSFGAARYELSYSALKMWGDRVYQGQPRESLPDFLLWYRGLAAGHQRAYNLAIDDFRLLLARAELAETADTLMYIPLETNDYRYVLALFHQLWGKPADAMRLYQETIANDLGLYMAHVRMAQMYRSYKMWDKAVEEAERAIATNPDDPTAVLELGVILAEAGRVPQAEATLEQAAAANPRDPRALYHLGVLRQSPNPAAAQSHLTRFVALAPAARYGREIADAQQRLTQLGAAPSPQ